MKINLMPLKMKSPFRAPVRYKARNMLIETDRVQSPRRTRMTWFIGTGTGTYARPKNFPWMTNLVMTARRNLFSAVTRFPSLGGTFVIGSI
jgi:hypothetical protein